MDKKIVRKGKEKQRLFKNHAIRFESLIKKESWISSGRWDQEVI